jgi:lycopene cyclase domain-containing protein
VWGFNEKHLIGIDLWQMPLEEYLFFFCIPYACVFTYFALTQLTKIPANPIPKLWIVGIFFLIIGVSSWGKAYPQVTFILLGLAWIIVDRIEFKYSRQFLIAYLLILLPFFLVNGVLTGSWIAEEVVWYNDEENFGVRMGTIPVEDTFYAMLLLLMNVSLYEWFKQRWQ